MKQKQSVAGEGEGLEIVWHERDRARAVIPNRGTVAHLGVVSWFQWCRELVPGVPPIVTIPLSLYL